MSVWTHFVSKALVVNATEEQIRQHFGEELKFNDSKEKWEDCEKNSDKYLPTGSEGSLKITFTDLNAGLSEVEIYGGLRDVDMSMELFQWYYDKILHLPDGIRLRSAKAKVECYPELIVWHYGEDARSLFPGTC